MNPYHRTGAGTVDDKTTRIVFASDSPNFTADGIEYDSLTAIYWMGTSNLLSLAYRLDGQIVQYVRFTYEAEPNPPEGSRLIQINKYPTPPEGTDSALIPTEDPGDDEYFLGGGMGTPEE